MAPPPKKRADNTAEDTSDNMDTSVIDDQHQQQPQPAVDDDVFHDAVMLQEDTTAKPPPAAAAAATKTATETAAANASSATEPPPFDLHTFIARQNYQLQNSQRVGHPFGAELYRLATDAAVHNFTHLVGLNADNNNTITIPKPQAFLSQILKHSPSCNYSRFDSFRTAVHNFGFRVQGGSRGGKITLTHAHSNKPSKIVHKKYYAAAGGKCHDNNRGGAAKAAAATTKRKSRSSKKQDADLAAFIQQQDYQLENDSTAPNASFGPDMYRLVEDAHQHGFTHLIRWSTNTDDTGGSAIYLPDRHLFVSHVLAHYNTFDSFETTLVAHGFTCDNLYNTQDAFCVHPLLQRGNPELAQGIVVVRDEGTTTPSTAAFPKGKKRASCKQEDEDENLKSTPATANKRRKVVVERPSLSPPSPHKPSPFRRPRNQRPRLCVNLDKLVAAITESENLTALLKQQAKMDDDANKFDGDDKDLFRCDFCQQAQNKASLAEKYELEGNNDNDKHKICQDCIDLAVDQIARLKVTTKGSCKDILPTLPFSLRLPAAEEHRYDLCNPVTFGVELHRLLDDASTQGFEFIVAWRTGGNSFEVYHRPLFVEWILGKDYKAHESFNTFNARLKNFGFVRVYSSHLGMVDDRGYIHPHFDRAKPEEASQVVRMNAMTRLQQKEYKEWIKAQSSWKPAQAAVKVPDMSVIMANVDGDRRKRPPLQRYAGDVWEDLCALCGDGGDLLLCECCSQVNHLKCVQKLFTVRQPGEHDDFLCHDCLDTAVQHGLTATASPTAKPKATTKPTLPKPAATVSIRQDATNLCDVQTIMQRIDNDLKRNGKDKRKYSLMRYKDEVWDDSCALCNLGGELYVCECCRRANHLACLQTYFHVKEPGPKDDFLCYHCMLTATNEGVKGSCPPLKVNHMKPTPRQYCLRDLKEGFGLNLYNLLEDGQFSDYISWSESGKSVIIPDREQFLENVVRRFASPHSKWGDFYATLYHQNFHRVPGGQPTEYINPLFIRGRPDLAERVNSVKGKRTPKPDATAKQASPVKRMPSAPKAPPPSQVVDGRPVYDLAGRKYGFGTQFFRLIEDGHYSEIIEWSSDGKSVIVHDRNAFISDVPSNYTKWQDFTCTLSRQGFRLHMVEGASNIYHPLLQRGMPRLADRIQSFRGIDKATKVSLLTKMKSKAYQDKLLQGMEIEELPRSPEKKSPKARSPEKKRPKGTYNLVNRRFGYVAEIYRVLEDAEKHGFKDVISWEPDGKTFRVHSQERFVDTILRVSSSQSNFSGFIKALRSQGFRKVQSQDAFWNPFMERGNPQLMDGLEYGKPPSSDAESFDYDEEEQSEEESEPSDEEDSVSEEEAATLDPREAIESLSSEHCLDFGEQFPLRLFDLLDLAALHDEEYEGTGLAKILSWDPSGCSFHIHRPPLMKALLKQCTEDDPSASGNALYKAFLESLARFEFTNESKDEGWTNDLFQRGVREAAEWLQPLGIAIASEPALASEDE